MLKKEKKPVEYNEDYRFVVNGTNINTYLWKYRATYFISSSLFAIKKIICFRIMYIYVCIPLYVYTNRCLQKYMRSINNPECKTVCTICIYHIRTIPVWLVSRGVVERGGLYLGTYQGLIWRGRCFSCLLRQEFERQCISENIDDWGWYGVFI